MKHIGRFSFAASEINADHQYLSGFTAPDAFLWMEVGGRQFNIVSALEYGRAKLQSKDGITVLSYAEAAKLWKITGKVTISKIIAAAARTTDTWIWQTPGSCPLSLANALLDTKLRTLDGMYSGDKIEICAADGAFCPERLVKTADEAEKLRQAEKIAQAGLDKALAMIASASIGANDVLMLKGEQLTSEMLQGEINAEIARKGGSATGTIAAAGVQGANPHLQGTGVIYAHTPIVMDIFPRSCATGYWGDLTRTVVKGSAPDVVRAAFDAVYDAQRTVLDMLKPGVLGIDAHKKADEVMASHGFKTDMEAKQPYGFIHGLGHGVGLEIHELPSLNLRNSKPLEAGNVVTVEPGLYYPEWGGIRIEDMVMITDDGITDFTTEPVYLEIQ